MDSERDHEVAVILDDVAFHLTRGCGANWYCNGLWTANNGATGWDAIRILISNHDKFKGTAIGR